VTRICIKSFVGWGFAPDPTWRSLQCSLRPLSCSRSPPLKGGKEIEEKEAVGRGREARGESSPFAIGRKVDATPMLTAFGARTGAKSFSR